MDSRDSGYSRKKDPIVTIGYVLASLVTSTAVLSNQRNTGSTCSGYQRLR
jgi:hypothetical protein